MLLHVRATIGVAAVAGPLLLGGTTVFAAEAETAPETAPTPRRIKISQLPIYGEPRAREFEYVEFEETVIMKPPFDMITVCRQHVGGAVQICAASGKNMIGKVQKKVPHITDFVHYIQQESGVIAKAVVISAAGLTGMALGYRGRLSRRALYTGIGMATATTICYPYQAADIAKTAYGNIVYPEQRGKHGQNETTAAPAAAAVAPAAPAVVEAPTSKKLDPNKVDHGMSKAEDKDMYTTRE